MKKYLDYEPRTMLALVVNGFWKIAHFGRFFFFFGENAAYVSDGVQRAFNARKVNKIMAFEVCRNLEEETQHIF